MQSETWLSLKGKKYYDLKILPHVPWQQEKGPDLVRKERRIAQQLGLMGAAAACLPDADEASSGPA